tara:strand:- start:184 stop:858 length:675 start_codon:yes stop_codon:yes gene_type:complete
MSTVRMSSKLLDQIESKAGDKFDNTNSRKEYPPQLAEQLCDEYSLTNKANETLAWLNAKWQGLRQEQMYSYNRLDITVEPTKDEDTDSYGGRMRFSLDLSTPREAPGFIVKRNYSDIGYLKLQLLPSHPVVVQCKAIDDFNESLSTKRYDFKRNIYNTMRQFTTLNQALKAAPAVKDLVPQDAIDKVYKKEDRKARQAELATIAEDQLKDLKEVLLTDALLGDD